MRASIFAGGPAAGATPIELRASAGHRVPRFGAAAWARATSDSRREGARPPGVR